MSPAPPERRLHPRRLRAGLPLLPRARALRPPAARRCSARRCRRGSSSSSRGSCSPPCSSCTTTTSCTTICTPATCSSRTADRPIVKISDFGISHELRGAPAIRPNVVHHAIMAPEILATGYTSKQSDLYQVGLLLYWMLTGRARDRRTTRPTRSSCGRWPTAMPRRRAEAIGTPLGGARREDAAPARAVPLHVRARGLGRLARAAGVADAGAVSRRAERRDVAATLVRGLMGGTGCERARDVRARSARSSSTTRVPVIVGRARAARSSSANDAAVAQYGYSLEELLEMRIHDLAGGRAASSTTICATAHRGDPVHARVGARTAARTAASCGSCRGGPDRRWTARRTSSRPCRT